jgi:hypothetical protein
MKTYEDAETQRV